MGKIKIGLFGAVGVPNLGDEAILKSNIKLLNILFDKQCEIYVFTKDASYTSMYTQPLYDNVKAVDYLHQFVFENKNQIGNDGFFINKLNEVSNIITNEYKVNDIFKKLDYIQFIGGGYLCSYWPDMILEAWLVVQLAKKYNIPYILTGMSAYIYDEHDKELFTDICNNAASIDLRDHSTDLNYLTNNNISNVNVSRTIDDAFYLDYTKAKTTAEYINVILHKWGESSNNILSEKLLNVIIPFMVKYLNDNPQSHINLLNFSYEGNDLLPFLTKYIPQSLKTRFRLYDDCITLPIGEVKSLIAGAEFNISSRFHASVFSISTCTPVFSLISDNYYSQKILSVHRLINDDNFISIKDLNLEVLTNFAKDAYEISKNIASKSPLLEDLYRKKLLVVGKFYNPSLKDKDIINKFLGKIPQISIIIPVYNMGPYLRKCLDSIVSQRLKNLEIICINDGSTDNSKEILDSYAWKDNRIKIIDQKNQGVARARNNGIKSAHGEFLFFMDPDDWLPDSDVLSDLYNAAKKNNVLVCGGGFEEYGINGLITTWEGYASKYTFSHAGIVDYKDYQFDYGWVRFIYNRNFILENKLFLPELTFFEDPVFFVKTMHLAKRFYVLPRFSYCYRSGHHSYNLGYNKVLDLLRGITENIKIAKENGYNDLLFLEIYRLKNDYASQIANYLGKDNSVEIEKEFDKLNMVLESGRKIEYEIFQNVISSLNYAIWINSSGKQVLKRAIKKRLKNGLRIILPNKMVNLLKKVRKAYHE